MVLCERKNVSSVLFKRSFHFLFVLVYFCRDNVEWDEEQERVAKETVQKNGNVTLSSEDVNKFEQDADKYWDSFYDVHQNR